MRPARGRRRQDSAEDRDSVTSARYEISMGRDRKYRTNAKRQAAYRKRKRLTQEGGSCYWLTPRNLYRALDAEFHFDFDPCPYPRPLDFDGTTVEWGKSNYVNPPFRERDAFNGKGPTAFVRKAIAEQKKGKSSVLLLPVQSYVNMLAEAGAELRPMGRVQWLEASTKQPWKGASTIACFVLRGER